MARRDNVKARRRLKKPKKIYTNAPPDKGIATLKRNYFDKKKISTRNGLKRYRGGHKWAQAVYISRNGQIRIKRSTVKEIRIPLQKTTSDIKSFNHWGLQIGNSPQKIHFLMKQMDAHLISQRVAPHIRQQVMSVWQKYKSAAWGFYRAQTPERKSFHFNVIKHIELNPHLLGLRGSQIVAGQKEGYFINNTPYEQQAKNYDYYETWYNQMLDKEIKIRDLTPMIDNLSDQDEVTEEYNGELDDIEFSWDNGGSKYLYNDPGDWQEYWFYSPELVESIIANMGGWTSAQTHYPEDMSRLCNNAGYTVEQMYRHLVHNEPLGPPSKELLYETIGTGHGAKFDVWEISESTDLKRRKN